MLGVLVAPNAVLALVCVLIGAVIVQTVAILLGDRRHRDALRIIEVANRLSRQSVNSQLRQIHTLVNSDMTSARQGELNQTLVTVIVMKRLRAIDWAAGADIVEDDQIIANTEIRAEELRVLLAVRRERQLIDEAEQIEEMRAQGYAPRDTATSERIVDPL